MAGGVVWSGGNEVWEGRVGHVPCTDGMIQRSRSMYGLNVKYVSHANCKA